MEKRTHTVKYLGKRERSSAHCNRFLVEKELFSVGQMIGLQRVTDGLPLRRVLVLFVTMS